MKRNILWSLLLVLMSGCVLFACGNNNNKAENTGKPQTEQTEAVEATESVPTTEVDEKQPSIEYLLENDWKDKHVPELDEKFASYLEGYDGYLALISVDGDTMKISSSAYDGDAKDSFIVKEVQIAEDVSYCELHIETIISDDGETSTDTYTELTKADMEAILDSTLGIGFVWFNEDMEIEKIMFYGALTIWE